MMASGAVGFAHYLHYLCRRSGRGRWKARGRAVCLLSAALVYRRIDRVAAWGTVFRRARARSPSLGASSRAAAGRARRCGAARAVADCPVVLGGAREARRSTRSTTTRLQQHLQLRGRSAAPAVTHSRARSSVSVLSSPALYLR
jgi:hypothetical protein